MDESRNENGGDGKDLSWSEVQEICGQIERMFHNDAVRDAQRLRALVQKREDIASIFETRHRSAQKHLAHLRANLSEWEEKEHAAKERNEQLRTRLQELEIIKRDLTVELERFRLNELTSKESLDMLYDKYEKAKEELVDFTATHQNDIPEAKNQMSLYASVTGIRWDFTDSQIAGDIIVPEKQRIVRFAIDPATDDFVAANMLWDKIDEAFDDINNAL